MEGCDGIQPHMATEMPIRFCCLVGLTCPLKCLAPTPPSVELDGATLPGLALASGGEDWVGMPWSGGYLSLASSGGSTCYHL